MHPSDPMPVELVNGPFDGQTFHVERRDYTTPFLYATSPTGKVYTYLKIPNEPKAYYERHDFRPS